MDTVELKTALAKLMRAILPELRRAPGPIKARVVKVNEGSGRMTALEPRYSVDVQPLGLDGADDPDMPVIPDVELPVLWVGPNRGVYCSPAVGARVRIHFYYGDLSMPYVEGPCGEGFDAPSHAQGAFLVFSGETKVEISPGGDVLVKGGKATIEGTSEVLVKAPTVKVEAVGAATVQATGPVTVVGATVLLGSQAAVKPVLLLGPGGPEPASKVLGF